MRRSEQAPADDAAVGAVVGFFTWGITQLIDVITDKKHKIAGLQIG